MTHVVWLYLESPKPHGPFVRPLSVVAPQDVAGSPLKRVPQGPVPVLRGPWEDADVRRPLKALKPLHDLPEVIKAVEGRPVDEPA